MSKWGLRSAVWRFLNTTPDSSCISRAYEMLSAGLSLLTIIADMVGSMHDDDPFEQWPDIFYIDVVPFFIFSVEYALRIWACAECVSYADSGGILCRLHYITRPFQVVDLIVIVALGWDIHHVFVTGESCSSVSSCFTGERREAVVGVPAVRIFRVLRVLALLKFERHTNSIAVILAVISKKRRELGATLFTAAVLMTVSAITMYHVENDAQPDAFPNIPSAMWWSTTALTTVGYGDICPITVPGKIVASIVAFFGVGLFALPAGILGSGFVETFGEASAETMLVVQEKMAEEEEILASQLRDLAGVVASLSKATADLRSNQRVMLRQQVELADQQRLTLKLLRGRESGESERGGSQRPPRPQSEGELQQRFSDSRSWSTDRGAERGTDRRTDGSMERGNWRRRQEELSPRGRRRLEDI